MRHSPMARRAFVTLIVAACCLALSTASAEPIPAPQLDSVFPLGGKIGTDVEVAVTGEALEGAQQLIFSHPGITASPVMSKPDRLYPDPRPLPDHFTIHIAADVPGGYYELRLANRLGVSAARAFFVGSADELVKRKP